MKITVFKKKDLRGFQIEPIFEINDVTRWRYEAVNDTAQIIIGDDTREYGRLILYPQETSFYVEGDE